MSYIVSTVTNQSIKIIKYKIVNCNLGNIIAYNIFLLIYYIKGDIYIYWY